MKITFKPPFLFTLRAFVRERLIPSCLIFFFFFFSNTCISIYTYACQERDNRSRVKVEHELEFQCIIRITSMALRCRYLYTLPPRQKFLFFFFVWCFFFFFYPSGHHRVKFHARLHLYNYRHV